MFFKLTALTATYYVSYLDCMGKRVAHAFAERETAWKCADYLSNEHCLEGVSVYFELTKHPVIGSDEMPF